MTIRSCFVKREGQWRIMKPSLCCINHRDQLQGINSWYTLYNESVETLRYEGPLPAWSSKTNGARCLWVLTVDFIIDLFLAHLSNRNVLLISKVTNLVNIVLRLIPLLAPNSWLWLAKSLARIQDRSVRGGVRNHVISDVLISPWLLV